MTTSKSANVCKLRKKVEKLFEKELTPEKNKEFAILINRYTSKDKLIKNLRIEVRNKTERLKKLSNK